MQEELYKVQIDNIFEGPMDLLVHLIKKHEMDIYDIPIALITEQYLEYLQWMKAINIDVAGDFILMASTLTKIKSRLLLPLHEDETDDEDPRLEIVKPLEEYLQMKSAANDLIARNLLGEDTFVRNPNQENHSMDQDGEIIKVGLFELIDAFQTILEKISEHRGVDIITADTISVRDRIVQIVEIFETRKSVTFNELFSMNTDKSEVVVTFLAILEMVRLSLINIVQNTQTGIIRLFYL
ncbi:MAG: segregation/condensation protein A [Desulfobacteraceae bacterium]|nr:segregation/condensation protein A [Desulfobacteraceae bacterium]MDH3573660.1 segregation/condensation protein A [Desulfobacteraceae bacterium]MDH3836223.1 segregation/condensation protein A [Desulfobacteraceae bacterium]MDH3873771.1 segregation/condensation protein A [Desulfobacteraceae bacterium]